MATLTKTQSASNNLGATPWGNLSALHYTLTTNAAGAALGCDVLTPAVQGTKIRLGVLPAGFKLLDSQVIVATAMTAAVVGKLGFEYTDGQDDAKVPQAADYFGTALNLAAAARLRNASAARAVVLPKDAYLVLTLSGADNAKASALDVVVLGVPEGVA
ncbi:hypothetical protein [Delftia sp. PS-11]|uniref:hypothetical protein n=1 Tax=Delftia sp. PS-11 TaxID=2767222 RepID=UPI002457BC16|nr:hypothetical protein [Delftia sp. PS-11]KAJ8741820.1 hypothetical protein H9T68_20880 [Delftia sp. PS-11]